MRHILQGLLYEAYVRSIQSYYRSLDYYYVRVREGLQPTTPIINLFDVNQQNLVLIVGNSLYVIITLLLFLYMKRRATGFRLRWLLCVYDAINVIVAAYIACVTLNYKLSHGGLLLCNPITNDPEGYRLARVFALFYFQKYLEFFDTWFFLLRKSFRQVTFLHLFHHSSITVVVGSIMPFDYNGDMYLPILLNSANHAAVYSHYLLTSLGLRSWWSSYITTMQLAQFTAIFAQSLLSYRVGPTCGSPDFAKVLMIVYMGSMVLLFSNFFLQRYILQRPYASLDLCGVIKRPLPPSGPSPPIYGTTKLNQQGAAVVVLPPSFIPPPSFYSPSSTSTSSSTATATATAVDLHPVSILLTPLGVPMPNLHVSRELYLMRISNLALQDHDLNNNNHTTINTKMTLTTSQSREQLTKNPSRESIAGKDHTRESSTTGNAHTTTTSTTTKDDSIHSNSSNSSSSNNINKSESKKNLSSLGSGGSVVLPDRPVHNDRLIDGPLPYLPSILSADKPLSSMMEAHTNGLLLHTHTSNTNSNTTLESTGTSDPSHTGGQNTTITTSASSSKKSNSRSSYNSHGSGGGGLVYCFSVAGGRPSGKVCWQVAPSSAASVGGVGGEGGRAMDGRPLGEDWRTIS